MVTLCHCLLLLPIGTLWRTVKPIYRLPFDRIVIAPWWLQGMSKYDDRLLEFKRSESEDANAIYMVRYVAACPLCDGKIRTQPGGREFHGRIVGRCENAPVEHVFSFDHITRNGYNLR